MTFGSLPFGESTFAGSVYIPAPVVDPGPGTPIGGPAEEPLIIDPYTITIADVSLKPLVGSLSIDLEYGRQGTASFTLVNTPQDVLIGQPVTIDFYSERLFSGSVDSVNIRSNNTETYKTYEVECVDHAALLIRKKIKQTFSNVTPWVLAQSAVLNYMGGDGVTLGDSPFSVNLSTVEADNVSIYDMIYNAAVSVGGTVEITDDKVINFRDATPVPAPMTIDENIAEEASVQFDRDTYRNYQVVYVTGTPVAGGGEAQTVSYTATNGTQIQTQAEIEGTGGVYMERDSVTHPTSNDPATLLKLAVSYANSLLAVNGELRQTVKVRTRQYGFKIGQTATLSLPQLGRTGDWFIRSVQMNDEAGRWLISNITLTPGTLRQRKQELWLGVVQKGSVTVVPPAATITNSQTFTTPGTYTFTVPSGVTTLQVTCFGAGGGGGGPARHVYVPINPVYGLGGRGGKGGMAISIISVTAGQVYTITVPSGGAGGTGSSVINSITNAQGSDGETGGTASVSRGAGVYCQGYGGIGGTGAKANSYTHISGIWQPSPDSGGTGTFITVGGGAQGGVSGNAAPLPQNSSPGLNGSVKVEW